MMQRNNIRLFSAVLVAMTAGSAAASSDDAWKEFAADVEAKCKEAAALSAADARAVVDPYGSEHYGLALVTGRPKGTKASSRISASTTSNRRLRKLAASWTRRRWTCCRKSKARRRPACASKSC
jgi:hypothetical protein